MLLAQLALVILVVLLPVVLALLKLRCLQVVWPHWCVVPVVVRVDLVVLVARGV